ncbi:MAG: radical SAM protein [Smithellaceae bacterium]|nr:radical SAM protein [Smithellaceae bacterium]
MGDGELWDGASKQYMAEYGNPKETAVSETITPYLYEDVQQTRRTFIEMSRGCRNKCLFCQYGWLKSYRECDIADIRMCIDRAKTKSIRVFAADRFQHSAYNAIQQAMLKRGKTDTGSDVSIKFILENPEYLQFTNKIRVGVEGLSYRLRKMVGKNYDDDDIVRFCVMVANAGIRSLDWYMIYGLPTETDDDVLEFETLLDKLNAAMPEGYTIAIHWNAFTPSAQTPLQWAAPAIGEFSGLKKMFNEYRRNDKIKIYHKPKLTSYDTIVSRMLAIRATPETAKLTYNFAFKKPAMLRNKKFLFAEYERLAGAPLLGEWPTDKSLPWDKFCLYKKDLMLKLYNKALKS